MEARELRIGNLIHARSYQDGAVFQVVEILRSVVVAKLGDGKRNRWPSFKECEGIPLTAEWLERLGFVEKKSLAQYGWVKQLAGWELVWRWDDKVIELERSNSIDDISTTIPCKHVHQLQNLYFALTGTELTLKSLTKKP